jgi:hypothetical protein
MPAGYEVEDGKGGRAWWDGKKLTPLDAQGFQQKRPTPSANVFDPQAFSRSRDSVSAIDDAKKRTNWFRSGVVGGVTANIPGSPAFNLDKDLDTLKARTAFEELAAMRKASPTGGALGNVTERELALLQASEANLDVGQGEGQLDKNLERMRRTVTQRTPGLDPSNPIPLTAENQRSIPEGAYFKAPDGRVYQNKRGAGPAGAQRAKQPGTSGVAAMTDAQLKAALGL